MTDNNKKQQVKELTDKLEQGVKNIFNSETYENYLKTMSRFHKYSTRNTILIHLQRPNASYVAGYRAWKDKFERHVMEGEKAIKILAPAPFVVREEKERLDPETNLPVLDENGMPVVELTEKHLARFIIANVYDVSQTDGKPFPTLVQDLTGNVEQYSAFMDTLREISPLPIVIQPLPDDTDGICRYGEEIAIREGMSEIQTVCAVIHEMTHAKLHDLEILRMIDENAQPKDQRTEEVESESVSYAVCQYFGIDTGANSFGYLAEWSRGKELKELNASIDIIRKTAAEMIEAIDGRFQEIVKERNIIFAIGEEQETFTEISAEPDLNAAEPQATDTVKEIQKPNAVYAMYCNPVAEAAALDEIYANAVKNADEQEVLVECEAAVKRVVFALYAESEAHFDLFKHYADNPDFKSRLEDYVFFKTYLETRTAQRNATKEIPALNKNNSKIVEMYYRNEETNNPQRVGSAILMTPVFDENNFNRAGKKIRVTVEEPIGKYQIFSREEYGKNTLYFFTASGRIDRTDGYFRDEWNEETRKWENYRPTEAEFDEVLPQIAEQFEKDMADPTKWVRYQHAAVVNRLDDCEAHNIPVRKFREEENQNRHKAAEHKRQEAKIQKQEKYDSRIDEIAKAIEKEQVIKVGYNENEYDGKNPVLDLFKLYNINLPLRTQGWVNTGLAEITESGYRYLVSKHKGNSTIFSDYLYKLRKAIKITPIEQKRQNPIADTEVKKTVDKKLYEKFAELFPQFANGEYSYLRLESKGFMPLSLEYIFGDRISVMHTYEQNGDLCYDPMMEFHFDNIGKTMSACVYEQSIPPIYQFFDDRGVGKSVNGDGEETTVTALQMQLDNFASSWFDNIAEQGYMPVRANMELDEKGNISKEGLVTDTTVTIIFDEKGNPIIPTPEKQEVQVGDVLSMDGKKWLVEKIDGDFSIDLKNLDPNDIQSNQKFVGRWKEKLDEAGFSILLKTELNISEKSMPEFTEIDFSFPDTTIGFSEMNLYGYTGGDMFPLTNERAAFLFDRDHCVYLLYSDNTEAMVLDRDEILNHDGLFGIERIDWEHSPVRAAQMAVAEYAHGNREAELLHDSGNRFGIYQIPDGIDEARNFRFSSMRELEAHGLQPNCANYKIVYTAPFSERVEFLSDRYPVLNNIYEKFNTEQPSDYTGRSVSVSDVIVLKCNDNLSVHYVDSTGFVEIDNYTFFGEEINKMPNAETPAQGELDILSQVGTKLDEYKGKSVAELEADVNAGKSISLMDLSKAVNAKRNNVPKNRKPTLMERLKNGKEKAARQGQSDTNVKKQEIE